MKALILSLALLGGCASQVTVPVPTIVPPPEALLLDCPEPESTFTTNGGLAEYALALRQALRLCNDDKAILREWSTTKESP